MLKSIEPQEFIPEAIQRIQEQSNGHKVVVAVSGGVDSATTAVLINKAGVPIQLITFDDGFRRKGEPEWVQEIYARELGWPVEIVDCQNFFFEEVQNTLPGFNRRLAYQDAWWEILSQETGKRGTEYVGLGTIWTDIKETLGLNEFKGKKVKVQHNVLPLSINVYKIYGFHLIEPLTDLVKWQVREVARELGIPQVFTERPPFPGPGLAVRDLGNCNPERIAILQEATRIVEEEIAKCESEQPSQTVVALLKDRATRIEGQPGYMLIIRPVRSKDFIEAQPIYISYSTMWFIRERIYQELPEITNILIDVSSKPPATVEYI